MPPSWSGWLTRGGVVAYAVLIFAPMALAAALVFYLLYATQFAATQRVIAAGQTQLSEVGYTTISNTLTTIENDAKFISDQPLMRRWLATGVPADKELLQEQLLSFAKHRGLYDQVRFIGTDGRELLRINWDGSAASIVSDDQLQDRIGRYYVTQSLALPAGRSYFSLFDLNLEGKPTVRVGALVTDEDQQQRGVVVLNYVGKRALDRVRRLATPDLNDAWLVDANGNWLAGPTPADDFAFATGDAGRSFAAAHPDAWQRLEGVRVAGQFVSSGDLFTYVPVFLPPGAMTGVDALVDGTAQPAWFLLTRVSGARYAKASLDLALQNGLALLVVLAGLAAISWVIAHNGFRRRDAEQQVLELNRRLARDNERLVDVNRELESFSYSVSHDLRAPLRSIDGFSKALLEDYSDALDDTGRNYLGRVRNAAQRMGNLIDDLIKLARVTRSELVNESFDLSLVARRIGADCQQLEPERVVSFDVTPGLVVNGDPRLLQIMLENLIGNAWKFTSRRAVAEIEFGQIMRDGERIYYIRDNGAGFDMLHASNLFGVFQRLHAVTEFEGTGIGLATVQRIVYKHGGRVWAEAERDKGATFFFTLRGEGQVDEANSAGRG